MDPSLKALLLSSDDPVGCEYPESPGNSFSWPELAASIGEIRGALQQELGIVFGRDEAVQDASYNDELHILRRVEGAPHANTFCSEIAIRFSNFGRLCVIFSALPEILASYPLPQIRAILERFGWHVVPAEALEEVYDGINARLRDGQMTWWGRFFDYL